MWFNQDYIGRQSEEKNWRRRLLAVGLMGMFAATFSSCGVNDDELKQLRAANKRLSDGINQILKEQNEKKTVLEKSLKTASESLEKCTVEVEKLRTDLKNVTAESALSNLKPLLDRKAIEQEKLKKEVAALKGKLQGIEDLKKELNALFAKPEKAGESSTTPKSESSASKSTNQA